MPGTEVAWSWSAPDGGTMMATEQTIQAAPLDGQSVRLYAEVTGLLARFNAALNPANDAGPRTLKPQPDPAEAEAALRLALVAMTEAQHRIERQEKRSEEHTSELQSLMRISYAVFCLKKK